MLTGNIRGGPAMSELRAVLCLVITLALPVALCGCPVAIVGGLAAAGGAGYAANQERGATGAFDDMAIKTNIQNAWLQVNPLMQRDFTITVYEGRTLLTGMTPSAELKAQAAQVASQIPGVRAIYNEIEVAPGEGAWASVRDTWISSQIRSNLVFASQVRSVNYTIDTVNGSVYLIGSARTQAELDRVTEAALALASFERPRVGPAHYREHLQLLARDVGRHPGAAGDVAERARALNEIVLLKYGYSGDALTYDDLQNANLMRVVDRRKGLPVALGILYMHAGRAQGWETVGLAFPGHFLVRLSDGPERLIIDPFHGGRICAAAELRELLKATTGIDSELQSEHYTPVSDR